jgi:hypothetical protein
MHDSCASVSVFFPGFHHVYGSICKLGEKPLDLTIGFEGY